MNNSIEFTNIDLVHKYPQLTQEKDFTTLLDYMCQWNSNSKNPESLLYSVNLSILVSEQLFHLWKYDRIQNYGFPINKNKISLIKSQTLSLENLWTQNVVVWIVWYMLFT